MKITSRQLRRLIRESLGVPTFQQWASENNLPIDTDPMTGEKVVLITDEFAMEQGLPDGVDWGVERSHDDDGWVVVPSGQMDDDWEEEMAAHDKEQYKDYEPTRSTPHDPYGRRKV